jgi:hypothetical protein
MFVLRVHRERARHSRFAARGTGVGIPHTHDSGPNDIS